MESDKRLRQQVANFLDWHEAHLDLNAAVGDFRPELYGRVPEGMPHSAWQLLEHIRLALWDIIEFCRDARHKSPAWPSPLQSSQALVPGSTATGCRKLRKLRRCCR